MKKRNRSEELAQIEERLEEEVAAAQDRLADAKVNLHNYISNNPSPWNPEDYKCYNALEDEVEDAEDGLSAAEYDLREFYLDPETYLEEEEEEDDGLRISDFI